MVNDFKSPSFIVGVSILLLVPFTVGGLVYSSLSQDDAQQQTDSNSSLTKEIPFGELARESNLPPEYTAAPKTSSPGVNVNSSPGIPIGKYSNPPTSITSEGLATPQTDNSSGNIGFNSEISSNPALPDYSAPNSSNNFNSTADESLVTPLETNELLEIPESNLEPANSLTPTTEPLFQP